MEMITGQTPGTCRDSLDNRLVRIAGKLFDRNDNMLPCVFLGESLSVLTDWMFQEEMTVNMIHRCHCCSRVKDGQQASIIHRPLSVLVLSLFGWVSRALKMVRLKRRSGARLAPPSSRNVQRPGMARLPSLLVIRAKVRPTERMRGHVTLKQVQPNTTHGLLSYFPAVS